jgi:hypothetical protein
LTLEFTALELRFRAESRIRFPPGRAANILRGTLGKAGFGEAEFNRFFKPRLGDGPSGLKDPPRPFVLRVAHLDGVSLECGETFAVRMNVFAGGACEFLARAAAAAARQGWGPERGTAELAAAEQKRFVLPLVAAGQPVSRLTVRFLTPTELKGDGGLAPRPEFGVLFARLRDRISTLRAVYGPGPLDLDFAAWGERAARVRMVRCDVRQVASARRSSGTGQTHPLGGFVGEAVYEGDLEDFLPFLRAGFWTGVGRQTVWGHGQIEVEEDSLTFSGS